MSINSLEWNILKVLENELKYLDTDSEEVRLWLEKRIANIKAKQECQ
jgi:hypothetical protein